MPSTDSLLAPHLAAYADGEIPIDQARRDAFMDIWHDDEATAELISDGLNDRIKKKATRHLRHVTNGDPRQLSFFGNRLRQAYALDIEERTIKPTADLLETEFLRAREVRRKVRDDIDRQIAAMDEAYEAVKPIWRERPAATYGEVERIYLERAKAA